MGGGWDVWRGDDGRVAGSGECGRAAWRGSGGRATGHADSHGGAGVGVCGDGCICRAVAAVAGGMCLYRFRVIGAGDVKLAAVIVAWLGFAQGGAGIFAGLCLGAGVVVWSSGEAGDFVETVLISGWVCEGLSGYGKDCCVL